MVEPNPNCRVDLDDGDCHLLQRVDRLWFASDPKEPAFYLAAPGVLVIHAYSRHRQPAWGAHSSKTTKSDESRAVASGAINKMHRFEKAGASLTFAPLLLARPVQ